MHDFRQLLLNDRCQEPRRPRYARNGMLPAYLVSDAVQLLGMGMKTIIAEFVLDEQQNQQAASEADTQPGDVEEGIALVLAQRP